MLGFLRINQKCPSSTENRAHLLVTNRVFERQSSGSVSIFINEPFYECEKDNLEIKPNGPIVNII